MHPLMTYLSFYEGLSSYEPKKGQINIMWNISHTDSISDREYEGFDHVFVSSVSYAKTLSNRINIPVSTLLQCADPHVFKPCTEQEKQPHDVLFVGNSRKVYRKIIKDAVMNAVKVDVYGTNWETFLPNGYLKADHIDNRVLHQHYAGTKILLNDHWDNMAKYGFLSNRLFDAGACGAFVISDEAEGLQEIFGDAIVTYKDGAELVDKINYYLLNEDKRHKKALQLQEIVINNHTFDNRIDDMLKVIENVNKLKSPTVASKPLSKKAA